MSGRRTTMSFSPVDSPLLSSLFVSEGLADLFSDAALLKRVLRFEAALATVQGRLGVIPSAAASEIGRRLQRLDVTELDHAALAAATARDGVPIPNLMAQLRRRLKDSGSGAADYLHHGATSQDALDTALVLQLRDALPLLAGWLTETLGALARLAREHRNTPMLGRTRGRRAVPITFGLKAANWLAPLTRQQKRLEAMSERLLVVQLGGAAGTLAPIGGAALEVRRQLAEELELNITPIAWHTQRDSLLELAGWLAATAALLAKMAQDVILLSSEEVGELSLENGGGSSTMPHKSNPIICESILAAARASAELVATMYHAAIQEHERAAHGWLLEWTALPQLVAYAGGALERAAQLAASLKINAERMLENLRSGGGLALAERITFALAARVGREEAARIVAAAARSVQASEAESLIDAARRVSGESGRDLNWSELADLNSAVGAAPELTGELLATLAGARNEANDEQQ